MNDRIIGDYRILRKMGAGGMAAAYLAEHVELSNLRVVLKVLHNPDPALSQRFKREANILALLHQCPHICRFNHVLYPDDHEMVIVMEYIDGVTLDALIEQEREIPLARSLRIIRETLIAVEYAHERGVFHRDIKPGNIMVDQDGITKVIDFGIARGTTDMSLTATHAMTGTPLYMAPEQFKPGADVDYARCDLYAVASTLYTLICRREPFSGGDVVEILMAKKEGRFEEPSRLLTSLPRSLDEIIATGLHPDPTERFANATAMREAVEAVYTETTGRTMPPVGDNQGWTDAADPKLPFPDLDRPVVRPKRGLRIPLFLGFVLAVALLGVGWWFMFGPGAPPPVEPEAVVAVPLIVPDRIEPFDTVVAEASLPVSFAWTDAADSGVTYQFSLARAPSMRTPDTVITQATTTLSLLIPPGDRYWQVQAMSSSDTITSAIFRLVRAEPAAPVEEPIAVPGTLRVVAEEPVTLYLDEQLLATNVTEFEQALDAGQYELRYVPRDDPAQTSAEMITIRAGRSTRSRAPELRPPAIPDVLVRRLDSIATDLTNLLAGPTSRSFLDSEKKSVDDLIGSAARLREEGQGDEALAEYRQALDLFDETAAAVARDSVAATDPVRQYWGFLGSGNIDRMNALYPDDSAQWSVFARTAEEMTVTSTIREAAVDRQTGRAAVEVDVLIAFSIRRERQQNDLAYRFDLLRSDGAWVIDRIEPQQ